MHRSQFYHRSGNYPRTLECYGKILRVRIAGCPTGSMVVKYIQSEGTKQHPRGWNKDIGHQRKLRSYNVETEWRSLYRVAWANFHCILK